MPSFFRSLSLGESSLHSLRPSLKFIIPSVFVHRYRDIDPNIRAQCVCAIRFWFRKYPGHFLDALATSVGSSQTHTPSSASKPSKPSQVSTTKHLLSHFTERFKPHLLEMAMSDMELPVRIAVVQVLGSLGSHSLLEEEAARNCACWCLMRS